MSPIRLKLRDLSPAFLDKLAKHLNSSQAIWAKPDPDPKVPAAVQRRAWIGTPIVLFCIYRAFINDFGDFSSPDAIQPIHWLGFNCALFMLAFGAVFRLRRMQKEADHPLTPGRYLTASYFLTLDRNSIQIRPLLGQLEKFSLELIYEGSSFGHLRLTFKDGHTESLLINFEKKEHEAILQALKDGSAVIAIARLSEDKDPIRKLNPFYNLEEANWTPPNQAEINSADLPFNRHQLLKGLAVCALIGCATWGMRNRMSDNAAFEGALAQNKSQALRNYVRNIGGRHTDTVLNESLPAAVFREAKVKGTVRSLRNFLREFEDHNLAAEVQELISIKFDEALSDFTDQAPDFDPEVIPFFTKLLKWQERQGSPSAQIRFAAPDIAHLQEFDSKWAKQTGRLKSLFSNQFGENLSIAPTAPYFSPALNLSREEIAAQNFALGFSQIFPKDILELKHGPPLQENETLGEKDGCRIEIRYKIDVESPINGKIYSGKADLLGKTENYGSIAFDFDVRMRIPGEEKAYDFSLKVLPPDQFRVNYQSSVYMIEAGPSDSLVYQVMVAEAFANLAEAVSQRFFREGTAAYRKATGLSD
jgi:hypothetical protein